MTHTGLQARSLYKQPRKKWARSEYWNGRS